MCVLIECIVPILTRHGRAIATAAAYGPSGRARVVDAKARAEGRRLERPLVGHDMVGSLSINHGSIRCGVARWSKLMREATGTPLAEAAWLRPRLAEPRLFLFFLPARYHFILSLLTRWLERFRAPCSNECSKVLAIELTLPPTLRGDSFSFSRIFQVSAVYFHLPYLPPSSPRATLPQPRSIVVASLGPLPVSRSRSYIFKLTRNA